MKRLLKPLHIGAHLRVLNKSYPINTNMTELSWFQKIFASLIVPWTKVALALKGLKLPVITKTVKDYLNVFPCNSNI